jgi:hypothetical protein
MPSSRRASQRENSLQRTETIGCAWKQACHLHPRAQYPKRPDPERPRPSAGEFWKVAIPVLNPVTRSLTAKWHRPLLAGAFKDAKRCCGSASNWPLYSRRCAATLAPSPI